MTDKRRGVVTNESKPAGDAGWARIDQPVGEPFQVGAEEWDMGMESFVVPERVEWVRKVDGQVRVLADFAVTDDGRVVCLRITHLGTPDHPVSSTAIRDVSLDEAAREALLSHALEERMGREPTPEELDSPTGASAAFFHTERVAVGDDGAKRLDRRLRGTRGRPPIGQDELEKVADVYRQAVESGSRKPVRAVMEHLGITSESKASRRVYLARKAGLLPPTKQGKAKG